MMRKLLTPILLIALSLSVSACYHAEVITGRPASNEVVEKEWTLGFINGLVIPNDLDVAEECEAGVARVETKLSFLNQLVGGLTFGLFTPMSVQVTCAEASETSANTIRGKEKVEEGLEEAASLSQTEKQPIYVQFAD